MDRDFKKIMDKILDFLRFFYKKEIPNNQKFPVSFFSKGKKAITPVVAAALLLVVAVVAVVGFQSWYSTYSSNLFVDVEENGNIDIFNRNIEALIGDNLYLQTGGQTTISSVSIDGVKCDGLNGTYSGMVNLNVSGCVENITSQTSEIVIVTKENVLSKTVLNSNIGASSESFDFNVGSQCRFKDNKTGCESYYETKQIDGIDVVHSTIHGLYWEQSPNTTTMSWADSQTYCSDKGTGWRLPTLVEMETSLIDTNRVSSPYVVGGTGPGSLFNNIQSTSYWTNTKYSTNNAFTVNFGTGRSFSGDFAFGNKYVFCVREDDNYQNIWEDTQKFEFLDGTGQERFSDEFIINASICGGNGTMYDSITHLCWEQSPSTSFSVWSQAVNRCDTLTIAEDGWRLPQRAELVTLLFHNGTDETYTKLNSIGFSGIQNNLYWSNTDYSPNPGTAAFSTDFSYGYSTSSGKSSDFAKYTLCVKNSN